MPQLNSDSAEIKVSSIRSKIKAENVLAYAGVGVAVFTGVLESLFHYGIIGDHKTNETFYDVLLNLPWFSLIVLIVCVAPKTLGRETVGKYLDKLPFFGK